MSESFLHVVNLNISASWLILSVLVLRMVLSRSPKWVRVLLWGLVGVRLVCLFSLKSAWSLIPSAQTISPTILTDPTPTIHTGFPTLNQTINPVLSQATATGPEAAPNLLEIWIPVLAVLWVMGAAALLGYAAIRYLRLYQMVQEGVQIQPHIFQCQRVSSPFVMGVFRPRIYLPYGLDDATRSAVIAHEQAHIQRRDHWWKLLGYVLLCVHWFNPLMWVAYVLLCRDIELACDEKVVKSLSREERADYSQALLTCSVHHVTLAACPLAFGEVGVKQRVKAVLRYRRPTLLVITASVLVCALVGVCFLSNPLTSRKFPMQGTSISDLAPQQMVDQIADIAGLNDGSVLCVNADQFELLLTSDFQFQGDGAIRFFYVQQQQTHSAQLRLFVDEGQYFVTSPQVWPWQTSIYNLQIYLEALKYLPQEEIRRLSPEADGYMVVQTEEGIPDGSERSITYTNQGAGSIDGWYLHLAIQPMHKDGSGGYQGSGAEIIHLFYGDESRTTLATYVGTDTPGTLAANDSPTGLDSPYLHLGSDGTFCWSPSILMSYAATGPYEQTQDTVTLYTNEGRFAYVFRKEDDTLIYDPDASTQHLPLEDWMALP